MTSINSIFVLVLLLAVLLPYETVLTGRTEPPILYLQQQIGIKYWNINPNDRGGMYSLYGAQGENRRIGTLTIPNEFEFKPQVEIRQGQYHSQFGFLNGNPLSISKPRLNYQISLQRQERSVPIDLTWLCFEEDRSMTTWRVEGTNALLIGYDDQTGFRPLLGFMWGEKVEGQPTPLLAWSADGFRGVVKVVGIDPEDFQDANIHVITKKTDNHNFPLRDEYRNEFPRTGWYSEYSGTVEDVISHLS